MDTDDNADPGAPEPDPDDPVTLPNQNGFTIDPDVDNVVNVRFGLLNP